MKTDRIFLKTLVYLFILSVGTFSVTFAEARYAAVRMPVFVVFVVLAALTFMFYPYRKQAIAGGA